MMTWMLMLLVMLLPCFAQAEGVVSYTADFYVADYANVLSDEVEGLIVLNNDQLNKGCGAQIVVVTVDTVGGMTIENYAYTLFNEWGIGDKDKNNGLLILLAVQDGNYWLMPGKGLQDYLTAGDLDEMAVEYLIPSASAGNYEEGVRQLFGACFEKVSIAYNADIDLDDSLYYTWLQLGKSGANGAKFLSEPVREMAAAEMTAEPVTEATAEPVVQQEPPRQGGGFSFMGLIIALIVLIVVVGAIGTLRARPGRYRAAPPPPPRRPAPRPPVPPTGGYRPAPRPPAPPRPPVGGYSRPAPRPPVTPRPPMGGASRPTGGYNRPMGGSRPSGGSFGGARPGGGMTRGGGTGGSFRGGR